MKKQKNLSVTHITFYPSWIEKTDVLLFPICPRFDQRQNTRKDPG